jgi:hypothetical protein
MSENEELDESAELVMPSDAVRREIELVQQFPPCGQGHVL